MVNSFRSRLLGSTSSNPLGKYDFTTLFFKEKVDNVTNVEEDDKIENIMKELDRFIYMSSKSDEIPNGNDYISNGNMKVSKEWWTWFIGWLSVSIGIFGVIEDVNLRNEIKIFTKKFTTGDFPSRLTTKEDINEANIMLEKVISYLIGRLEGNVYFQNQRNSYYKMLEEQRIKWGKL